MKRIIASFVTVMMVAGLLTPFSASAKSFSDVPTTHTFFDEITYLSDQEIINGFNEGTFAPSKPVTRAAAAAMIGRAIGLDGEQRATTFEDVGQSNFASGYIQSAVEAKVISGYTDGTYKPGKVVTRGEMAIFLARAFDLTVKAETSFRDVSPSMAASDSILKILAEGITGGYTDGTYRPNQDVTRDQFSAFLARALDDRFKQDKPNTHDPFSAHFIDVGQGDSTLLTLTNGKTILIDGGRQSAGEKVVSYLKQAGVDSIDLVVATHPDADHIGGLLDVLKDIPVKKVLDSGKAHTSHTYLDYLNLVDQKNIPFEVAKTGQSIDLDSNVQIKVLHADENASDNNDASIVLRATNGCSSVLLTADAGHGIEDEMIRNADVQSTVLRTGHHGSDTSTSKSFVEAVNPSAAILSYGENSYGHPDPKVLQSLKDAGSEIYSTYEMGDIVANFNGCEVTVDDRSYNGDGNGVSEPAPANVMISSVDVDAEVVTIKNNGKEDVDMTGWKLVSEEGNQSFDFPNGFVLKAGRTVHVTSGKYAAHNPPVYLKWTGSYIWNNEGDSSVIYNAKGVKVSGH
ncbi:S-layer homology domain-containing protein [Rossellomorea vietnamensis]|uniref:S-layer homology domain-containing protein n=1 Tax=Rossellomorea vietnamensis TaxID=218284 RepID=UPI00077C2046|nr:S-layer homology domain-containing protein [Rossellomorea vietnamensis]